MDNRKKYIHLYWMPATVFLLGTLAFTLILWANIINDRQRSNVVLTDAIMDMRVNATVSHLWLEEALTNYDRPAVESALSQMDKAIAFSEAVLRGGVSEHGRGIAPLEDPVLRERAQEILDLLKQLRSIGVERSRDFYLGRIGSPLDLQFNAVFRKFEEMSRTIEFNIERSQIEGQKKSRRLFLGMFISWSLLLALLTAMLSSRELKRRQAEESLQKAKDCLEIKVKERTSELTAANELLRRFSAQIMSAQESERKRISRELHDELGQVLTLLKLRFKSLGRKLEDRSGPKDLNGLNEIKGEFDDITCCIDDLIDNMRRISRDLSPAVLEDLGLTTAVRYLVNNFNNSSEIAVGLKITDIDHLFTQETQIMIYRVLQEALTNIGKHSRALSASVVVRKEEGRVVFFIEDAGRGFDIPAAVMRGPSGKGLGLAIMEERIRMLEGTFEIRSEEGKGTRLSFSIPVGPERNNSVRSLS